LTHQVVQGEPTHAGLRPALNWQYTTQITTHKNKLCIKILDQ
jgi:hypothetical protein